MICLAASAAYAEPGANKNTGEYQDLKDSALVSSDQLLTEGKNYFLANNYAAAMNSFRQFALMRPNNFPVHFWMGLILDQKSDADGALNEYRKALEQASSVDMDSAELRVNLANTLAKMGYTKEPLADYQRAIVIDSLNPLAFIGLSKCLIDSGDYAGALKAVEKFGALGGHDINVPLLRGLAFAGLGKYENARQELRNYLAFTNTARVAVSPALTELATKILAEIENTQAK